VRLRPTYPATFAALTLAAALCGCAPTVFDSNQHWFSRPFDVVGRNSGYTFSELQESREKSRAVTATDLVSANGACPPPPGAAAGAPVSAPGAGPGSAPVTQALGAGDSTAAPTPGTPALGIALGMTECEVVWHVGTPSSVQIGSNPNGDRTALMTFDRGPQAGIYHFERGRLSAMDGVAASAARPKVATRAKRTRREPSRTEQISTE
jgi:hypothetical protein